MIFIIVGTQEPFDRMVEYIDQWSEKSGYHDIYAQIAKSKYMPKNFKYIDFLPPDIFDQKFKEADLIVSHAGMGSIISALQFAKPIIVIPRLAKKKEHRNDHQLATANSFNKLGYVKSVYSKDQLFDALDKREYLKPVAPISKNASIELINTIMDFCNRI